MDKVDCVVELREVDLVLRGGGEGGEGANEGDVVGQFVGVGWGGGGGARGVRNAGAGKRGYGWRGRRNL